MSKQESGEMVVTTQHKSGGKVQAEDHEERELEAAIMESEVARAQCKLGMTVSLGDYEFFRVDVGVDIPCELEDIRDAQKRAYQLSKEELVKRVQQVKENLTF